MGIFSDTYHIHRPTEYVTKNVNVVEQRAPTDASVALLREMEENVQRNILSSVKLDMNGLNVHYYRDHMFDDHCFAVDINGKKSIYKVSGFNQSVEEMINEFAKQLAGEILVSLKQQDQISILKSFDRR